MIFNLIAMALIIFIVFWFWVIKSKPKKAIENKIIVEVKDGVYSPSEIKASANQSLELTFVRRDASPCAGHVIFKDLPIHE